MPESNELQQRFQVALRQLAQEATQHCDYTPEEYLRGIHEYGGLKAAKQFLSKPPSDDSLHLWARGRTDLTIEALARSDEWADLFSEEDRLVAERRFRDWSLPTTCSLSPASPNAGFENIGYRAEDPEDQFYLPEDDIAWGEELLDGVNVCEKLAQENRRLRAGYEINSGWVIGYYRRHLADCQICAQECSYVKAGLEEHDALMLKAIRELASQCVSGLRCSIARAKDLLSAEWRAAGFELLPSEAESAGITDYGWKNPFGSEQQQMHAWLGCLQMRAAQLATVLGGVMVEYEKTHISQFSEELSDALENQWVVWRRAKDSSAVARLVRGLSDDEFVAALLARHLVELQLFPSRPPYTLPTDGDLSNVAQFLDVVKTSELDTWAKLLSANVTVRKLVVGTLILGSNASQGEWESRLSDLSRLDWGRILHMARFAASREASTVDWGSDRSARLPELSEVTDRLDSISAVQIPMIDLLERLAANSEVKIAQRPNIVQGQDGQAAQESLEAALGTTTYNYLSEEARTNALSAEQILHNRNFQNPGLGLLALCTAFECELKNGLLTRFCTFLRSRRINHFPGGLMQDGNPWPQIIQAGAMNARLSMGQIALALRAPHPEIGAFCASEGTDLGKLRDTISYVKDHRNPRAHGGVTTFVYAQRIRERLLGIASGDGGVFGILVPRDCRTV